MFKKMIKNYLKSTFVYKKYRYYIERKERAFFDKKNKIFKEEAVVVFNLFSNTLLSNKIFFWAEFGTLLGIYRENDFIKHDIDIDTGAFLEDRDKINKALTEAGFDLIRYYYIPNDGGREECYLHNKFHVSIDVFYFRKQGSLIFCNCFHPLRNMSHKRNLNREVEFSVRELYFPFEGFVSCLFKGIQINIPSNTANHLSACYGPSFMIPDPNFKPIKNDYIKHYSYKEKPAIGLLKKGYND